MTELILLYCAGVLGAGFLLVWMANPWRSLIAWVCLLSVQLNYELFFPDFRPALSDIFLPSLAVGLLFAGFKTKGKSGKPSALSTLILAFSALLFLVGNTITYFELRSIPQWTWLNKDIGLLDLLVCYFAFLWLVDSRQKLQAIVKVFVLSGSAINVVAVAGGIARYAFGISNMMMGDDTSLRLVGFNINPSSYGGFLLCVFLIQFALVLGGSKLLGLARQVQYINLALLGMACLMTLSRSALMGTVVGVIALFLFFPIRSNLRLVGVALMILLATYAVVHWYAATPSTSSEYWDVELSGRTFGERLDANKAALHMYLDRPATILLGTGLGVFYARSQQNLRFPVIIHNDFLWLLVEAGPLGLILFSAIFFASLRNCFAVAHAETADSPMAIGIACALIGTLAWTMGTEGLWHRHVWLLLALSEGCYRQCERVRHTVLLEKFRQLLKVRPRFAFASSNASSR